MNPLAPEFHLKKGHKAKEQKNSNTDKGKVDLMDKGKVDLDEVNVPKDKKQFLVA